MTVLTLYRVPRRFVRKLLKAPLLWLNAWRYRHSVLEAGRLHDVGNAVAAARESRRQVDLMKQRRKIGGW